MAVLSSPTVCRHQQLRITTTRPSEFVDLTDRLETLVAAVDMRLGLLNIQTLHTTTAIVVNEHEPLLLDDFDRLLDRAAPRDLAYRHDDLGIRLVNLTPSERANGHAHCRALLLGTSVCLHVIDGKLRLGCWQRVFLVELDGPREREISVMMWGEGAR
jgi:secondary thiamine-phosphate synthase enzyme